MKNKIPRIIFIISFLPYAITLLYGLFNAITGMPFFNSVSYGFEAFYISVFFMLDVLIVIVPIIPVCLIYQICYILRKKVNKFKNVSSKKFVRRCCIIGSLLVILLVVFMHSFEIGRIMEKINAKQMVSRADEKISFRENYIMHSGIFGMPEFTFNHILIDYDNMEIGMLLHVDIDQYWEVELEKTTEESDVYQHIINDYYMQVDIPLNAPGKRLMSFYVGESNAHRTRAFILICEDGTIYYADNIKEEDSGFDSITNLSASEYFVGEKVKFDKDK